MNLNQNIKSKVIETIQSIFDLNLETIEIQQTKPEFEGDVTLVLFPLVKLLKENPQVLGTKIGENLIKDSTIFKSFNIISGFLNLVISDESYLNSFNSILENENFGTDSSNDEVVMVEFASPNTNKPLHLGHIRNILLGYSVAKISEAAGKKVYTTQIVNDRGIHICKSMVAWQKFGNGETPETSGLKGDKLVGKYYVEYNKIYQEELEKIEKKANEFYQELVDNKNSEQVISFEKVLEISKSYQYKNENLLLATGSIALAAYLYKKDEPVYGTIAVLAALGLINNSVEEKTNYNIVYKQIENRIIPNKNEKEYEGLDKYQIFRKVFDEFKLQSPILQEAQDMLRKWEAGDEEVMQLWKTMNQWVYDGFEVTYKNLGVHFDSIYYESNTYLLGKEVVQLGLEKGVFEKDPDGSVWIDLTPDGLDRKIVLRSDGTAVYMTQDIGTAIQRVKDQQDITGMVYTVGNEQDYHFKVLFLILKKLGFAWANNLYHLSYGMVELPSGRMKSREGTVVDADDLMDEMTNTAQKICEELGKLDELSSNDKENLYKIIGDAALKYFMLKVDPKKQMLFNPEESVDFSGNTGPFIQYTYARIQSILRKANFDTVKNCSVSDMHLKEKELIKQIMLFPETIQQAAQLYSPALVANYTYSLVKEYNSFYQSVPIIPETDPNKKEFRIQLSYKVGTIIKKSFELLGIEVPNRM
jgi:arginyl-tRNA synthetase